MDPQPIFNKIQDYSLQDLTSAHSLLKNAEVWQQIKSNQQVIEKYINEITTLQDLLEVAEKNLLICLGEEKRLLSVLGTAQ